MNKTKNVLSYIVSTIIFISILGCIFVALRSCNKKTDIPATVELQDYQPKHNGRDTVNHDDTTYIISVKVDSSYFQPKEEDESDHEDYRY